MRFSFGILRFLVTSNNNHKDKSYPSWEKASKLHASFYVLVLAYEHIVIQIINITGIMH